MLEHSELIARFKAQDRVIYFSGRALRISKGNLPDLYAREILSFLQSRYSEDYLPRYIERCRRLQQMQAAFESSGRYAASRYGEVQCIDEDTYRLSLLLSFLTAHHRFEILQWLVEFLQVDPGAELPQAILSIGFGAGYEIKLIQDYCPGWELFAFDNAEASHSYTANLLRHFNRDAQGLHLETFPLENDTGIAPYLDRFGKIVMCEVMEHLEKPTEALRNLKRVLHPRGTMFLTMAINIAQEDHIFLYSSIEEARQQVLDAGFRIVREWATPVTLAPSPTAAQRANLQKGNYVCIVRKDSSED